MKKSFCIAYGGNTASFIDATKVTLLNPLRGLDNLHKSKEKYDVGNDLLYHTIPKGSDRIPVIKGNPIRCIKLGYDGSPKVPVYLIMDSDCSYLAYVDKFNTIQNVTICKGYNPFSSLTKNFTVDESFLYIGSDFYQVALSKSIYDFVIHGGRYAIFEGLKNNFVITPTICKRKNIEDVSMYTYKILGTGKEEYEAPMIEYVNGQFSRLIQFTDERKVVLDEHDLKSDSELRWITNFRWPSLNSCLNNYSNYYMVDMYIVSNTLRVDGYMSNHIFSFITRNNKIKSFIYDPIDGSMTLIL